jgi:hypothetical protein
MSSVVNQPLETGVQALALLAGSLRNAAIAAEKHYEEIE